MTTDNTAEPDASKCINGHEWTEKTTYINTSGYRQCRVCIKIQNQESMFGGNREKVIERDGSKCVKCGMTREQHFVKWKKDIAVDHIDRMGKGVPKRLKNNKMSNLQTLCNSCHARKDCLFKYVGRVKGSKNHASKINEDDALEIVRLYRSGMKKVPITKLYPLSFNSVNKVITGETWSHVTGVKPKIRTQLGLQQPSKSEGDIE